MSTISAVHRHPARPLMLAILFGGLLAIALPAAGRNLHELRDLPARFAAVHAAEAQIEVGVVDASIIDAMVTIDGRTGAARRLLGWATRYWKVGNRGAAEAALDEFARVQATAYLDPVSAAEAAFLWTDLAQAQPYLPLADRIARYDKALAISATYPDALALKGLSLATLGQRIAGEELMLRALNVATDHDDEGTRHIGRYYGRGATDAGIAGEAWIRMRLGEYYLSYAGEPVRAEDEAARSLALYSDNEWAQNLMARILVTEGRCAAALPYADRAVDMYGGYAGFLRTQGDAHWCLDEKTTAIGIYRQVVDKDPTLLGSLASRLNSAE